MSNLADKPYETMTLIEMAQTHIDRCQYDLAALLISMAQVQAQEAANEIERVKLAQITRLATVLELIAGKRGIVYTKNANGV